MKHLKGVFSSVLFIFIVFNNVLLSQTYNNFFEITPQFVLKSFQWGEYNDNSVKLLEETGIQYGGGVASKIKFSSSLDLFIRADFYYYAGLVDYDGFLMLAGGGTEPYKTKTGYQGIESTLNFGYDFYAANQFVIAPELGFQFDYWLRDLDNGGKRGYEEVYSSFLIDFGTSFIYQFSRSSKIFLSVLAEYPLNISESIDLASRGQGGPLELNLESKPNIGLNMELGGTTYGIFLSFYMDYMLLSKSNIVQELFQPESDRMIVGVKLGYAFSIN